MDIYWLGYSCFRIKNRDLTVITDPFPRGAAGGRGKQTAGIVTVSHKHPNHNYIAGVSGDPAVIDAPGEYEVSGLMLTGLNTYHDAEQGAEHGKNTIFLMEFADLTVAHLGDLGHPPTSEQMEQLTGVDILMAPAGGERTLSVEASVELISQIEPKVVLPMHYQTGNVGKDLGSIDRFLKVMSLRDVEPKSKLSATKSSLGEDTQVVLLSR